MLCSILVRRLKEGVSYDDFHRAWFSDQGFGVPARVRNGCRVDDPRELLSVGFVDLPLEELAAGLERVAAAERQRHDRIAEVVESTAIRGIYTVLERLRLLVDTPPLAESRSLNARAKTSRARGANDRATSRSRTSSTDSRGGC
jgi:hypothetical protein